MTELENEDWAGVGRGCGGVGWGLEGDSRHCDLKEQYAKGRRSESRKAHQWQTLQTAEWRAFRGLIPGKSK